MSRCLSPWTGSASRRTGPTWSCAASPPSCRSRGRCPLRLPRRYLVLKYGPNLPLFDERFINYGYNKIEYMEQLRFYRTAWVWGER